MGGRRGPPPESTATVSVLQPATIDTNGTATVGTLKTVRDAPYELIQLLSKSVNAVNGAQRPSFHKSLPFKSDTAVWAPGSDVALMLVLLNRQGENTQGSKDTRKSV